MQIAKLLDFAEKCVSKQVKMFSDGHARLGRLRSPPHAAVPCGEMRLSQ